jgi:hypothetical protein
LEAANGLRNNNVARYKELREWLKSVLYYRSSDDWYCGDAEALLATTYAWDGRGDGNDFGARIAIARFLMASGRCSVDSAYLAYTIASQRAEQLSVWRDTVRDSIDYPTPDTTVPTIDELGLGLLRGQSAVKTTITMGPRLSKARIAQNPFENTTAIEFSTGAYTLVKLEIFDELGNLVGGNLIGQVLDPGEHRFEFDGSALIPGNYYARLSCPSGEHITVKLQKR